VQLTFRCLRDGEIATVHATQTLTLAPRETRRLVAAELIDHFFDFTYAYRFGPPAHDVVLATLHDPADSNALLSQAAYLPDRRAAALRAPGLSAQVEQVEGVWWLTVSAQRFARWVHIEDHAYRPEQDWFHLGPGESRRIRLMNEAGGGGGSDAIPSGEISALNAERPLSYDA
jgi:beta-mannosidase